MSMVIWWVDAPYNNNKYFKVNTGYMMFLGKVVVVSSSREQIKCDKLNRKIISGGG